MKSQKAHSLYYYLFISCCSFFFLFSSSMLHAQSLSSSDAEKLAREAAKEAGFTKIYFTTKMLNDELATGQGLNLYSGLPDGARSAVLMINGATADGTDIGDSFTQNNEAQELDMIDRITKDKQVANITNHNRRKAIVAFFPAEDIQSLLTQSGVSGLHFMPAKSQDASGSEILILNVAAASSPTSTMTIMALRSPCPPECPR